jgi:hypothetical protein
MYPRWIRGSHNCEYEKWFLLGFTDPLKVNWRFEWIFRLHIRALITSIWQLGTTLNSFFQWFHFGHKLSSCVSNRGQKPPWDTETDICLVSQEISRTFRQPEEFLQVSQEPVLSLFWSCCIHSTLSHLIILRSRLILSSHTPQRRLSVSLLEFSYSDFAFISPVYHACFMHPTTPPPWHVHHNNIA